jgi:N-acetyl-gamma-glutamyl-phosphate reductase
MTTHVFIDGAAGTTGLEIRERLNGRSEFSLITLDDAQRKDATARKTALNDADVVILCLPDDAAKEAVSLIDNDRTKVIDASTAHRTATGWIYGFPEISGHAAVAASTRISNPGCYSTGFIGLIAPLVRAGLIAADLPLTCNAVSGYSGGGKSMIAEFEGEAGAPTAWRTYALSLAHKHVPEMQQHCGLAHAPLFAPAVVSLNRGMIVEVPLNLAATVKKPSVQAIREAWEAAYAGSRIVSVNPSIDASTLTVEHLSGIDRMELFLFASVDGEQLRLVAALDNLGKGASGAAVQNLNIVSGLDEASGLKL